MEGLAFGFGTVTGLVAPKGIGLVFKVALKVFVLEDAALARADGFESFGVVGVLIAEVAAAVLTYV
jgi:hypothetical protein